jgi:hypothetical protein
MKPIYSYSGLAKDFEITREVEDELFEQMWKYGKHERERKKDVEFFTEKLPKELNNLNIAIEAFSKIKLNDRGLPF